MANFIIGIIATLGPIIAPLFFQQAPASIEACIVKHTLKRTEVKIKVSGPPNTFFHRVIERKNEDGDWVQVGDSSGGTTDQNGDHESDIQIGPEGEYRAVAYGDDYGYADTEFEVDRPPGNNGR